MWGELSGNAENLLGRLVVLGTEHPGGDVPDQYLWEVIDGGYDAYHAAAEELVDKGLAVTDTSDFVSLRATPEGKERIRGL